ncbi:PREDICTED: uncharacterized protein LOC108359237 [Rhagoletis zephyria]|uniref:uncharacterized protein LOC108359237 n=1 Tax=Rhagoletis zephyria TaxID=28612 RepID=UPI000811695C|nr:PREDICTED: uncharacterized protein LOC108359237 [Rhagoletis zephyria]
MQDITAETVAKAFLHGWIAHFGVPDAITTDQGKQFESKLFNELSNLIGAKHLRSTAYHPQANGLVERMHRTLKTAVKCHTNSNWVDSIPIALLGLRTAFKEDLNATPAEMVYGENLKLPGEFFDSKPEYTESDFLEKLKSTIAKLKPVSTTSHAKNKVFVQKDINNCTHVFVRDDSVKPPLKQQYDGPFEVAKRFGKYFDVVIGNKVTRVSIDRLKAAHVAEEDSCHTPMRRPTEIPTKRSILKPTSHLPTNRQEETSTRVGRKVNFPKHFADFI